MGLDMYLTANLYISRMDYDRDVNGNLIANQRQAFTDLVTTLNADTLIEPDSWTGFKVGVPVGYWRKANQIHNYIVQNHADGVDECQEILLSPADIRVLRDLCQEVLDHHNDGGSTTMAESILPTAQGFFFGSYEYDEYYYADLVRTVEICNRALAAEGIDYFVYQASW